MNAIICACGRRYEYERSIGIDKPYWHLLNSPGHDPDECSRLALQHSTLSLEEFTVALQELSRAPMETP